MLEIEQTLVLSTAHVTGEIAFAIDHYLAEQDDKDPEWLRWLSLYPLGQYGWLIRTVIWPDDTPEVLKQVLSFAKSRDCDWVLFDPDGPTTQLLPEFDW